MRSARRSSPGPLASASPATLTTTARRSPASAMSSAASTRGLRRSAGRMYLLPAQKKSGRIDVRIHARAFKIVFEGKKAVAVRYVDEHSRTIHDVKARK